MKAKLDAGGDMRAAGVLGIVAVLAGVLSGCSSELLGTEGPTTACAYAAATTDDMVGVACEKNEDCGSGVCIKPGDGGNITNAAFSFCTRACNCNDDKALSIESSNAKLSCVCPGGCFPDTGASRYRHAVLKCASVDDCQAIDSRYTDCATTDTLTVYPDLSCGQLHKVCQAHK